MINSIKNGGRYLVEVTPGRWVGVSGILAVIEGIVCSDAFIAGKEKVSTREMLHRYAVALKEVRKRNAIKKIKKAMKEGN
jgi:hypothetical protein